MEQEKPAAPPAIPPVPKTFKLLGHNYQTPDIVAKVTGQAKYAEDFRAEGMVFIKLMPSPRPHARIVSIDASAALAMPGVHGILTADDLPAVHRHCVMLHRSIANMNFIVNAHDIFRAASSFI